jgi:hypothetical protein
MELMAINSQVGSSGITQVNYNNDIFNISILTFVLLIIGRIK